MLKLVIDGVEVEASEGSNLVNAALKAGIEIPTYCYHPGLSVVGQCRICFVEIEGAPRLVTACSTPVREGMVVHTASDRVQEARAAVMEFLLANHPLDCPVCDQAGECGLQNYSVEHGMDSTHMVEDKRTFAGLEQRRLGPEIVQNQNRCIHCTRCIRFTREISETSDLTMKKRGNHAYIDTFGGEPFDNPWSACVADVCPVGALTNRDFRFQARVWHLEESPSICPGCSIGCSISVGSLDGIVKRFTPRQSPEINAWWLCDYGRGLSAGQSKRDIQRPTLDQKNLSWGHALNSLAELLSQRKPRIIASANLSNEALYLVQKVLVNTLGLEVVVPVDPGEARSIKNAHGDWIHSQSSHPNSRGVELIGLKSINEKELKKFVSKKDIVILDNRAHPWLESEDAAEKLKGHVLAAVGRVHTALSRTAGLVIPSTAWTETEGSVTSSTGRVQFAQAAVDPKSPARPMWSILSDLGKHFDLPEAFQSPAEVFAELAAEAPAFAGMSYRRLAQDSGIPALEEVSHVG